MACARFSTGLISDRTSWLQVRGQLAGSLGRANTGSDILLWCQYGIRCILEYTEERKTFYNDILDVETCPRRSREPHFYIAR